MKNSFRRCVPRKKILRPKDKRGFLAKAPKATFKTVHQDEDENVISADEVDVNVFGSSLKNRRQELASDLDQTGSQVVSANLDTSDGVFLPTEDMDVEEAFPFDLTELTGSRTSLDVAGRVDRIPPEADKVDGEEMVVDEIPRMNASVNLSFEMTEVTEQISNLTMECQGEQTQPEVTKSVVGEMVVEEAFDANLTADMEDSEYHSCVEELDQADGILLGSNRKEMTVDVGLADVSRNSPGSGLWKKRSRCSKPVVIGHTSGSGFSNAESRTSTKTTQNDTDSGQKNSLPARSAISLPVRRPVTRQTTRLLQQADEEGSLSAVQDRKSSLTSQGKNAQSTKRVSAMRLPATVRFPSGLSEESDEKKLPVFDRILAIKESKKANIWDCLVAFVDCPEKEFSWISDRFLVDRKLHINEFFLHYGKPTKTYRLSCTEEGENHIRQFFPEMLKGVRFRGRKSN